ncbi:MAG TPA: hypothetical protein GXZ20_07635 [Halanaerobiaceae bacterium]|jgi:hypothetical protein|nr:hypothetical protein [Bacillota bacterium]HHU92986.1 hypothetical protein [Halanaerobiaceae bacterium]HOA41000.1 hypothetical protein [Halanaerobiales bacterium]HPZ63163.1 hypothetical protein [Halanaerobiales bacterium]HQD04375.1 hypothetical protein [Halanaerobiales bacterium]
MEQINIISFLHNNGLFFSLYNYFILFLLILSIVIIFCLNSYFSKINKNVKEDIGEEVPWIKDIIEKYKLLLKRQRDLVNTPVFIENYFLEKKRIILSIINIIENSDKIFILLGLFGTFYIVLQALINFNFDQIVSFQELNNQFGQILLNLKPALFVLLLGIISAVLIKIILKSINLKERFNSIKNRLVNHLENNIKYKYNRELKELELLGQLIQTVEEGFKSLENAINKEKETNNSIIKKVFRKEKPALKQDFHESIKDVAATEEDL